MKLALLLLTACMTATSNAPMQPQSRGQTLEGVWTGTFNEANVRAEFDTGYLTLDLYKHRYEGFYEFDGAIILFNDKPLDATLTDTLEMDLGPLLPNTPEVRVTLSRAVSETPLR